MAKEIDAAIQSGIEQLNARAAELGLTPASGNTLPGRDEFTVNASDVEDKENRKRYRYQPFPKAVHAWVVNADGTEGPEQLLVNNPAELEKALGLGWQEASVHGPSGRLTGNESPVSEPLPSAPREILAPGAKPVAVDAAPAPKAKKQK